MLHSKLMMVCLTLSVVAGSATELHAQNLSAIRAQIPFEFQVNDHTMPAGDYLLQPVGENQLVFRLQHGTATQALTYIHSRQKRASTSVAHLLFHRYPHGTFFAQMWSPDSDTGIQARRTKAEKVSFSVIAPVEVAVNLSPDHR